jgi:hypothetical protein
VIKVEPPKGETTWRMANKIPPQPISDVAYQWHLTNRNKRGMAIDLRSPRAGEILERLVKWADVLIVDTPHLGRKKTAPRVRRCSAVESPSFARSIGLPLNTHLIIHWGGTLAGDDPDGKLFAKFRYLFDKRFRRKFGIPLTGIWVRERHRNKRTQKQSEVTHSHLLLHLPARSRVAARQDVEQLVTLVARPILDDRTIELTFPANPDGK